MKYIAGWSGGKDSTANIILAHENNEPLDSIIFCEVMFDKNISGELPEHLEFMHRAIAVFSDWGYEVKIVRSDKTYMDCFNHILTKSSVPERIGKKVGFPMSGRCVINRDCKVKPINAYLKAFDDYIYYVGIAADEPERLQRLKDRQVSLLAKYGYTEDEAKKLCQKYNLLSPIYNYSKRSGCWFCPNAKEWELQNLRKNHNELWQRLIELAKEPDIIGDMWNTRERKRIADWENIFRLKDRQINIMEVLENE